MMDFTHHVMMTSFWICVY